MHLRTLTTKGHTSLFSVPITLSVSEEIYQRCKGKEAVTLVNEDNELLAIIKDPTFFLN